MIENSRKLRETYRLLNSLKGINSPNLAECVKELKREIREYNRREQDKRTVIVKDNGIDGYVLLEQLDGETDGLSLQETEEWFKVNREIRILPSAYGCTGRAFTSWFKIVRRRGHWYAYHSVCYDV